MVYNQIKDIKTTIKLLEANMANKELLDKIRILFDEGNIEKAQSLILKCEDNLKWKKK